MVIKSCQKHLCDAKESYIQHFCFAMVFALTLIGAGCAVFIHAFIPALFQTKGSSTVRRLYKDLDKRIYSHTHET